MPLPLNETRFDVGHRVHDELDEPAVQDPVLLPQVVVREHVAELPLAVAARRAQVLGDRRLQAVGERVEDLLELLAPRHVEPPVGEVVAAHDGEAAAAAAAVVVDAVRLHLPELRADGAHDLALRLDDAHQAHQVARVVQRHREVVARRVELQPPARDDVAQQGQRTLARDVQIAGQHAVGDDRQRLVGVAALAEDDLLDPELLRRLGVLQRDPRELGVVVPEAVVDRVVARQLGGEGPGDARRVEDQGEGAGVLRPREDLAGVVDQEHVGALDVPRRLDREARALGGLLVDELDVVLDDLGRHAGRRADLQLEHRPGVVDLLRGDPHLLAEQLAQLVRHQAVVGADRAGLRAAPAQVAAVGQLDQPRHQRPVHLHVAVLPGREQAAVLDELEVQPAHQLRPVGRPVELVAPARLEDMARLGARLALRAVLHAEHERLEEGPVVLGREELLEPREELGDERVLLLLGRGLRHAHRAGVVQRALVLLGGLRRQRRPPVLARRVVERGRQRHQVFVLDVNQGPAVPTPHVGKPGLGLVRHRFAPSVGFVVTTSAHVRTPSAVTCFAAHVGRYVRYPARRFSIAPPRRLTASSHRTEW